MDAIQSARRRVTITLFLSQSFFSAAMIAAFTLLPILAAELSGRESAAGLPSTINLIGRALAAYPIGWLMDRIGRRLGLSLGYAAGVIGMGVAAWAVFAGSFIWFLAGVGLFGMGRGASELSRYVAAEVQTPDKQAKAIGLIVFAGTIGAVGGPLLVAPSGRWAVQLGLLTEMGPFVLGMGLFAIGLILVWTFLRPDPKSLVVAAAAAEDQTAAANAGPLWLLFANARVLLALGAMVIGQLVMTLIMVITPLHMHHQQQGTEAISLVIMAHTLGMFGLSWLTGGLIDRYGRLAIIFTGSLILIAAAALTPAVSSVPMLALVLFLLGLGWNFCFVAGSSLLTVSVAAADKGRAQGAADVVVALSSGAGSLGSGAVFAGGGIAAVSGVGLAFVLALLAGAAWFSWSNRTAARLEPGQAAD